MIRELILYAVPRGPLAAACDRYFEAATTLGATTAQAFPPHCTLTGFFRRSPKRADAVLAEIAAVVAAAGPVPSDAVSVVDLIRGDRWIGLELESPWLRSLTADVITAVDVRPGEDALRPKEWLHLSLAYGIDELAAHADLATEIVETGLPVEWDVAVWERSAGPRWVRHGVPVG